MKTSVYKAYFETVVDIPKNGIIVITFPVGRVVKDTSSTTSCTANTASVTSTTTWTGSGTALQLLVIKVTSMCTSICPVGTYEIKCMGGMKAGSGSSKTFTIDATTSSGVTIQSGTDDVSVSLI